jgi:predicted DNA-binding protein
MLTVRLPYELEQRLEALAKKKGSSKTRIIKEALEKLLEYEESAKDSYALGKELFGRYGSGDGSLSISYKKRLKEKLHAKQSAY